MIRFEGGSKRKGRASIKSDRDYNYYIQTVCVRVCLSTSARIRLRLDSNNPSHLNRSHIPFIFFQISLLLLSFLYTFNFNLVSFAQFFSQLGYIIHDVRRFFIQIRSSKYSSLSQLLVHTPPQAFFLLLRPSTEPSFIL